MPSWFWPKGTSESTVLVRLGRAIHWIGYGIGGTLITAILVAVIIAPPNEFVTPTMLGIFPLGIAIIGRAARYILSNE